MENGRNIFLRDGQFPALAQLVDLDKQPFPDRELIYNEDRILRLSTFKAFMSGRGCPYKCTYCFNHAYNEMFKECGHVVRKKSVDYMLEELSIVKRNYPLQLVSFQDDTFIIDKKWVFEFCEKYRRTIGVPFVCNVRPNLVTDEVAAALKAGGCTVVSWSIESGNERVRNKVLCRNVSTEQMDNTASILRKYGIKYRTASVIGVPTETKEDVEETIEANIRASASFSTANIFVPYSGLRLTEHAVQVGLFRKGQEMPNSFFVGSILSYDKPYKNFLRKTAYLMPLFAGVPWTYRTKWARSFLYLIPSLVLRMCYEFSYLVSSKSIYQIKISPTLAFIMAVRYLRSLVK